MVAVLPTYLLTIAYDGSRYHGWQQQVGVRTIQAELEKACAKIGCAGVHVEGAGRTDTGVHAFAQGAHVILPRGFPGDRLQIALNSNLPEDTQISYYFPQNEPSAVQEFIIKVFIVKTVRKRMSL